MTVGGTVNEWKQPKKSTTQEGPTHAVPHQRPVKTSTARLNCADALSVTERLRPFP